MGLSVLPLIECFVGANSHLDFVSDTHREQSSLRQVQRDLSDDLIEAVREECFAHWADPTLLGLPLHEFLVEKLAQVGHVLARGRLMASILDQMLAFLDPLTRGQDRVQDIVLLWLDLQRRQHAGSFPLHDYTKDREWVVI